MYQVQYITLSDVPIQVPDDYSDEQKRNAIKVAEQSAELDLNDGAPLTELPPTILPNIETAIQQKATAELLRAAEDPDDTTIGDLNDDGTTKADYAERYDDQYASMITKIQNSDVIEDTRDDSAYVFTTHTGGY